LGFVYQGLGFKETYPKIILAQYKHKTWRAKRSRATIDGDDEATVPADPEDR
jgi:hypothetical protein